MKTLVSFFFNINHETKLTFQCISKPQTGVLAGFIRKNLMLLHCDQRKGGLEQDTKYLGETVSRTQQSG
jgi:hypothetical protein